MDADLGTKHGRKDFTIRTAQVVLALGFWAGLRPSEIISLKFENVDVDAGRLTVCESIVNHVHADRTKTDEDRVVTYLEPLVPILRAWKAKNGNPTSGFVVTGRNGGVVNLSQLSDKTIYPNCKKNGMGDLWKGTAFYGLRRGCGTLLVETGSSCEQGAKFLGNTSDVFEKNYWVDKGEMAAQASGNYKRNRRAKQARLEEESEQQEERQQKQLRGNLASLGLAEVIEERIQ